MPGPSRCRPVTRWIPAEGPGQATRPITDAPALGAWWGRHLARWVDAGLAGARVLGLGQAPGALAALRSAAQESVLIAWTPGLPREALAELSGASFVVSSLPWWDFAGDWFWDELQVLRQIAPVLACPEAPFGQRVAAGLHDPARVPAVLRRAAAMAVATGDGWLVPEGFEVGVRRPMDVRGQAVPFTGPKLRDGVDLAAMNHVLAQGAPRGGLQFLSGGGAPVLATLRTDAADARFATKAALALLNVDPLRAATVDPASALSAIDGSFERFRVAGGRARRGVRQRYHACAG